MYKSIEKPIVHIFFSQIFTEVYFNNIAKILRHPDFDTIIIEFESAPHKAYIEKLDQIISENSGKTFFVQSPKDFDGFYHQNVLLSATVSAQEVGVLDSHRCQVVFILFDLSKDYTEFDWNALADCINQNSQISFFASFTATNDNILLERCAFILNKLCNLNAHFFFTPQIKSAALVIEHPCNAYLCNGTKCHGGKSPYPRYIYLNANGAYPYQCMDNRISFLQDISQCEIRDIHTAFLKYKDSDSYKLFVSCNKYIFASYILPRVSNLLAWNIMLQHTLQNQYNLEDRYARI